MTVDPLGPPLGPPPTPLPVDDVLTHVAEAQSHLDEVAGALRDADVRAPSALDGWTRGHVLTHLARNADSQIGMLQGALRGEVVAQYPGGDAQRSRDIEQGAPRPAAEQAADLQAVHQRFLAVARSLSADDWRRPTLPRAGERPAWASAYARWREVEVHHVDLGLPTEPGRPRLTAAFAAVFLPPELDRLADRLPPAFIGTDPERLDLRGDPAECLLWLMGRPADSVRLTVDGVTVDQRGLTPWALTMWMPGAPA